MGRSPGLIYNAGPTTRTRGPPTAASTPTVNGEGERAGKGREDRELVEKRVRGR